MRYKVGDIVKVKEDCGRTTREYTMENGTTETFVDTMDKYRGGIFKVVDAYKAGYLLENTNDWNFVDGMLEPVSTTIEVIKEVKVKVPSRLHVEQTDWGTILRIGNYTIYTDGVVGVSRRHPDDSNVPEIGEALALKRMLEGGNV